MTQAQQLKRKAFSLRIETDTNGTPRLYDNDNYLGVASDIEAKLWSEIMWLRGYSDALGSMINRECGEECGIVEVKG